MKRAGPPARRSPLAARPGSTERWQRRSRDTAARRPGRAPGSTLAARSEKTAARRPADEAWRQAVFTRDGWACQFPHGAVPGAPPACWGPLDPQHIIPKSVRPDLRLDPANGVALCRASHDWVGDNPEAAHALGLHGWSWSTVRAGRVVA